MKTLRLAKQRWTADNNNPYVFPLCISGLSQYCAKGPYSNRYHISSFSRRWVWEHGGALYAHKGMSATSRLKCQNQGWKQSIDGLLSYPDLFMSELRATTGLIWGGGLWVCLYVRVDRGTSDVFYSDVEGEKKNRF